MDGTTSHPLPELPSLGPDVYLLEATDRRGPLHALVVDHLSIEGGIGYWIDAHGHATTHPLADLAPSDRILDRIEVARGFTPQQHYAITETLAGRDDLEPGVVVAPALDGLYRDDALRDGERTAMLVRAIAKLAGIARRHGCPVLLTRAREDDFSEPIASAAGRTIRCESTPMGPRFVGDGFETLVYPVAPGWVQTTLAFWERVLAARAPAYRAAREAGPSARSNAPSALPEVTARGSN